MAQATPIPALDQVPVVEVPLDQIRSSKCNPRKTFGNLEQLAASIREVGVLQPILVRPCPGAGDGMLEIVFGERRCRAAKQAGLKTIPARARELGDLEVLEAQLAENGQRDDVHPLEEADGYATLHGIHGKSVPEIAARLGKTIGYIYARLKLTELVPAARTAYLAGQLTASTALLVARIPDAKLQAQATQEIAEGAPGQHREPMSHREAGEHIQRRYMLRLAEAPFKAADATLCPTVGNCTACTKRTGNQRELFGDVSSADVCTDPNCYKTKAAAAWNVRAAAAKAAGQTVLEDKAAKKIFATYNPTEVAHDSGYLAATAPCYGAPGAGAKTPTWAKALGQQAPAPVLVQRPDGAIVELYPRKLAEAALNTIRRAQRPTTPAEEKAAKMEARADAREDEERKIAQLVARRATAIIVERIQTAPNPGPTFWHQIIEHTVDLANPVQVARRRGFGDCAGLLDDLPKLNLRELAALAWEVVMSDDLETLSPGGYGDLAMKIFAAHAIDVKKLRREVLAELKAAAKAKKPRAKGKPAVPAGRQAKAATEA